MNYRMSNAAPLYALVILFAIVGTVVFAIWLLFHLVGLL
jgi:hypothetical protein